MQLKPDPLGGGTQLDFVALTTIAEVGAALAGFATLAGAIKSSVYDSETIFGVVLNSLIALVFSLLALRFGSSAGSLRVLAVLLAVASSLVVWRGWRLAIAARAQRSEVYDLPSWVLGCSALLSMLLAPPLSILVAGDVFPIRARLLYESALLCNLLVAVVLMLYVVWRNFAMEHTSPAA